MTEPARTTTKKTTTKRTPAAEAVPGSPADPPPPGITADQLRYLHVLFRDVLGMVGRDDRLEYLTVLLGHPVESTKDLTLDEASRAIDHLNDPDAPKPHGPSVIEVIADIKRQMRPVGKDQRNIDQGYAFRGISDVMDQLSPLMARHGLVYVPHVEDVQITERPTRSGGTQIMAVSRYRWAIYGPGGDHVEAVTLGQGLDTSDKSINKAATAAEKYMLTQVFAIAFRDTADEGDLTTVHAEPRPSQDGLPTTGELLTMLDEYAAQMGIDRDRITAKWRHENGDMALEALDSLHPTVLFPLVRDVRAWIAQQQQTNAEANP